MNPLIKKELESCKVASIPQFDDNTTLIHIPKGTHLTVTPYQVHKFYIVELASYITNPPPDNTLSINWNRGTIPKSTCYKCEIAQVMGKMVRINGCGYDPVSDTDLDDLWEGWVPQQGLKLIKELT